MKVYEKMKCALLYCLCVMGITKRKFFGAKIYYFRLYKKNCLQFTQFMHACMHALSTMKSLILIIYNFCNQ